MLLIFSILGTLFAWAGKGMINTEVLNLRNDQGVVDCALYSSKDGFPSEASKALQRVKARPSGKKAVCKFSDLAPADYAISVIHDENENGKMDANFLGMPKEGVGSSNDAKGFMGPPSFEKAKFHIVEDGVNLNIHLVYL